VQLQTTLKLFIISHSWNYFWYSFSPNLLLFRQLTSYSIIHYYDEYATTPHYRRLHAKRIECACFMVGGLVVDELSSNGWIGRDVVVPLDMAVGLD